MAIRLTCTCGRVLNLKDSMAGKKGKCPHCGTVLTAPNLPPPEAKAASPLDEALDAAQATQGPATAAVGEAANTEAKPHVFRSIVLLTSGAPRFVPEEVKERLARTSGLSFSDEEGAAENFIVGGEQEHIAMAKLGGGNLFVITLLKRSYWESEDVAPYEQLFGPVFGDAFVALMKSCEGAILVDAMAGGDRLAVWLAKLAAACMGDDTPVMVIPPSWKAAPVGRELIHALAAADEPAQLMPHVASCHVLPDLQGDGPICMTMGLSLFDLPNVVMRCRDEEIEAALAAVQSASMYQLRRGQAFPVGDTMTIPGIGDLRAVEARTDYPLGEFGGIELERM